MTDREFAEHVLERQEHLIGAMHKMLDTQEVIRDTCFEILGELRGLSEWLREPPSTDLGDTLAVLIDAVQKHTMEDRERHKELIDAIRRQGA